MLLTWGIGLSIAGNILMYKLLLTPLGENYNPRGNAKHKN
jgi:hypothetical protein